MRALATRDLRDCMLAPQATKFTTVEPSSCQLAQDRRFSQQHSSPEMRKPGPEECALASLRSGLSTHTACVHAMRMAMAQTEGSAEGACLASAATVCCFQIMSLQSTGAPVYAIPGAVSPADCSSLSPRQRVTCLCSDGSQARAVRS